jgi:hypothetical protein
MFDLFSQSAEIPQWYLQMQQQQAVQRMQANQITDGSAHLRLAARVSELEAQLAALTDIVRDLAIKANAKGPA